MNDQPKPQEKPEKSARLQQIEARRARMATFKPERETVVRVNPANDKIRKGLKHPSSNARFPESGSVEWPLDGFTKRRLRDGSVTREGGEKGKQPMPKAKPA